jgi:hypothetical protein
MKDNKQDKSFIVFALICMAITILVSIINELIKYYGGMSI